MNLLSWNIQAGRGQDGVNSLERIARIIAEHRFPDGSSADVICLQEVARRFPDVTGGIDVDQAAMLGRLLPGYRPIFRPAVDLAFPDDSEPARRQFGCMILSRYPVIQVFNHLLTQRGVSAKGMQRQALEAVVAAPGGTLRVMTTHLEFNSQECRVHQVGQLKALQEEAAARTMAPRGDAGRASPYTVMERPPELVLCGDFNFLPDSAEYDALLQPLALGAHFMDAWKCLRPDEAHASTCGWDDPEQWPQGPHCRDFFFVAGDLAKRLSWTEADTDARASDHQPILLAIETQCR